MLLLLLKLITGSLLVVAVVACNQTKDNSVKNFVEIKITGELTRSTLDEFKQAIESIENNGNKIVLNAIQLDSNGGNGFVAREIGDIIRAKKLNTYVGEDSRCESACVFILIGGVQRYAFGKVGVHRTTYSYTPKDDNEVKSDIAESVDEISEYIKSMGVSLMLDDAINTTESWRMRYLTQEEKRQWQIFGIDRLEEELYFNRESRESGIARKEIVESFRNNYEKCLKDVKNLNSTIFECASRKKMINRNFLEKINHTFQNYFK